MNEFLKDANKLFLIAARVFEKESEAATNPDEVSLDSVAAMSLQHGMALLLNKYRGHEGSLFVDWDYVDHVLSEEEGIEKPEFLAFLEKTFKCEGCHGCIMKDRND